MGHYNKPSNNLISSFSPTMYQDGAPYSLTGNMGSFNPNATNSIAEAMYQVDNSQESSYPDNGVNYNVNSSY